MNDLSTFSDRPYRFIKQILFGYFWSHTAIALAVAGAVTCSVSMQYGIKALVDALSNPAEHSGVWAAFALLVTLIAADNMLWRVAAWIGHSTFVNVSGSVRRKLFRHLTGHSPNFFCNQSPGALTSRITSTANALYTTETMVTFNAMPPLIATFVSILFLATVSIPMALCLTAIVTCVVVVMF
jgi:ATP-binding cassette subfamily B protein